MAFAVSVAKYVPPPNIREDIVQAYAHCPDPRCKGTVQEVVQAVQTTTEWTFASRGGGDDPGGMGNMFLNMVENSQTSLRFLNDGTITQGIQEADAPDDTACQHCGKPRELSAQERPVIPMQIGGANALLRLQEMGVRFDPERQDQIQAGAPETPLELLQRRYISDEITETEFAAKRAVLAGGGPAADVVVAEVRSAQDDRIEAMQAQIDALLQTLAGQQLTANPDTDPAPAPKRGPGRPRKEPDA